MPRPRRLAGLILLSCVTAALLGPPAAAQEPAKPAEAEKEGEKNDAAKPKAAGIAHIRLTGEYDEGPQPAGLFGQIDEGLRDALGRIKKAKDDDKVAAVLLVFDDPTRLRLGWAKVNEFRHAIREVRSAGKPVYAWLSMPDNAAYALAAACDEVYMPESGVVLALGLRAEVTFYKNLFDRLAIRPEVLRVGEFKSAAEPFTRTEMSEPFRQEMTELLDDLYGQMIAAIAEGRGLTAAQVEAAIDRGPLTAADAKELGLVDGLAYEDGLTDVIKAKLAAESVKVSKDYGKKKVETDFSGLTGFIELMNLIAGVEPKASAGRGDKVAVVYATGAIMTGKSGGGLFAGETLGHETLVKAIEKARDDDTVKAVVLRVDSPGGSALASDLIWHALETLKAKKPVVASMGDVAASGGYYISMNADEIVAEPGTITGSIGVVGGKVAVEGLLNKIGVTTSVVERGRNSGALSILTGFSESERIAMQALLDRTYEQFTRKAAAGRDMKYEDLERLARGRIYSGTRAKQIGLIDEVGTLATAVDRAKTLARDRGLLGGQTEPGLLILPTPRSPLEELFGPLDDSASANAATSPAALLGTLAPELAEALSGFDVVNLLARERVLTMMPFGVSIR